MKPESKPTPGPWEIHERFTNSFEIQPKVAWLGDFSGHRKGENRANAELIAAAPEMLAALEIARDEFERLNGAGTCPLEIEDAIAKAKGETPA